MQLIDRRTGEVLPGPEEFIHTELGAMVMQPDGKAQFRRNVLAHNTEEIRAWRKRYSNIGVFRSMMWTNEPDLLEKYNEETTLFYAPLTFDMDANKDPSEENWKHLVDDCRHLISYLVTKFKLKDDSCVRVWFSGGRGFHIEILPEVLGIYPHHELGRIFSRIALDAASVLGLEHLDLSLYGSKHLFRLEGSVHQRTGLMKWPMKAMELAKAYDYNFMTRVAKTARTMSLWTAPEPGVETTRSWDQVVAEALVTTKRTISLIQNSPESYKRHDFRCVEMQFEQDYVLPEGNRYNVAYILAMHLFQNSFTYEAALAEMMDWATNHCSPPYIEEENIIEWQRMLDQVYEGNKNPIGCRYIQTYAPVICEEDKCPIGKRMISQRLKATHSQT